MRPISRRLRLRLVARFRLDDPQARRLSVPDQPGGLAGILKLLSDEGISIEYLYSFVRRKGNNALIVFRVEEIERAARILTNNGVKLLSQEEICDI